MGLFRPSELTVRPAAHSTLLIKADEEEVFLPYNSEARLRFSNGGVQCRSGDDVISASVIRVVGTQSQAAEFILGVPGKISRRYRGSLEVSTQGEMLMPVVVMELETAVASAVAAESPSDAPQEALKAQAVVTRSYYLAGLRHVGLDFCDTTHCQFLREPPPIDSPATLATAATRGLVLTYEGKVIRALFSASCGGRTRSLAEAGLSTRGYPYYAVQCEYCLHHAPEWEKSLDVEDAPILLGRPWKEANRLEINRKLGWDTVPGNNFAMEENGRHLIFRGSGHGHGVGLCQLGASGMASQGANFQQVLNQYFPNSSIEGRDR